MDPPLLLLVAALVSAGLGAVLALRLAPRRSRAPLSALGRYRVEREIGRGTFAVALLAREPEAGEHVVLKRFHDAAAARAALREARALTAVRHPRVVRLRRVERIDGEIVLVLDHVPGGSLRDLLARHGPLPPARALALARDVLDGLSALHAAGLVHCDVKPSNVLLDAGGHAVLGDFGAARFLDVEDTIPASEAIGSLATIAPEVLGGAAPSPAADVYSAGALLYRLLTAEHYVSVARERPASRDAILGGRPRLPHPCVPDAIAPVIARALAKRPADRYPDAAAMRRAIDEASGFEEPRSRAALT